MGTVCTILLFNSQPAYLDFQVVTAMNAQPTLPSSLDLEMFPIYTHRFTVNYLMMNKQ